MSGTAHDPNFIIIHLYYYYLRYVGEHRRFRPKLVLVMVVGLEARVT